MSTVTIVALAMLTALQAFHSWRIKRAVLLRLDQQDGMRSTQSRYIVNRVEDVEKLLAPAVAQLPKTRRKAAPTVVPEPTPGPYSDMNGKKEPA